MVTQRSPAIPSSGRDELVALLAAQLVGVAEVAEILGVSKRTAIRWIYRRRNFPAPIARVRATPLWLRAEVERWRATYVRVSHGITSAAFEPLEDPSEAGSNG